MDWVSCSNTSVYTPSVEGANADRESIIYLIKPHCWVTVTATTLTVKTHLHKLELLHNASVVVTNDECEATYTAAARLVEGCILAAMKASLRAPT